MLLKTAFAFILLTSQYLMAQEITAKHTVVSDPADNKTIKAVCAEKPGFECFALGFGFPKQIKENLTLRSEPDSSSHGAFQLVRDIYQLYDSLGRISTYFYEGSLVSGRIPFAYAFTYRTDNIWLIDRITDDHNQSWYECIYDSNDALIRLNHYDADAILIEWVEIIQD